MRSIKEEVYAQLSERVIPELLAKLKYEIPKTGKFEDFSVSFDIPHRITSGKVLIAYSGDRYPEYRRLDVDVTREDIGAFGATCSITYMSGTHEEIIEFLSSSHAVGVIAGKCKNAWADLIEYYDEEYNEAHINEMWDDAHYREAQFDRRYPLTKEAKRIFFDLNKATTKEELYQVLDNAVERYEECRYINPTSFVGFGLQIEVTLSNYTQMKDADTDRPIVNPACEIIKPYKTDRCAVVRYIG